MKGSKHLAAFTIVYFAFQVCILGQVTSPNLVQEEAIEVSGITTDAQIYGLDYHSKITTRVYMDGLGRVIQNIGMQASPTLKDILLYREYNALGQEIKSYLPFGGSDGSGSFHTNGVTDQANFYNNGLSDKVIDDAKPYSQKVIEGSPLQRILNAGMNGVGFQPISGDHYKSVNYRSNNSAYSRDTSNGGIRLWNYDGTSSSIYANGSLSVTELTDESGNVTVFYKNAYNRIILKRQIISSQIIDGQTETCLDTYYVYDDAAELRVIIPPKALVAIRSANPNPWNISVTGAVPLVFQINYDSLGRIVEKKSPGGNWNYIVYDPMNRPVLVQDGNLGSVSKWLYYKYDSKGRVISQGIYKDLVHTTRLSMQGYVNGISYSTYYYEEKQTGGTSPNFYTNRVFPTTNQDASALQDLFYNYYDDYDFNLDGTSDYSYTSQGLANEASPTALTRGLSTGTFTKTLSNDAGTLSVWLLSVSFYDKRGNVIQVLSNNHTNTSSTDTKTIVPDFIGKTLQTKIIKTVNSVAMTVYDTLGYDFSNRLTSIDQSNNGASRVRISNYIYNEIGQIVNKKLHSTDQINYLQNVDYRYNVNFKLTSINNSTLSVDNTNYTNSDINDLFGEEILYEKTDGGIGNAALYNGNISALKWAAQSSANSSQRSYIFNYDQLNRITDAFYKDRPSPYTASWGNAGFNDEKSIQYDHDGNIEKLKRYFNNATSPIDDLTYTYSGNQLSNVTDAGTTAGFNGSVATAYTYGDNNGNLTSDPKRGINIAYNILNKTDKVSFTAGTSYLRYTYDASGNVIRKEAYNGTTTTTFDYVDGFVYQNLSLSYFFMAEGRVRNNSGTYVFEYFIKDHLGNVRVSFDGAGSAVVRQENSYYPFGMTLPQNLIPSQPNNNLYNGGSELQNDLSNLPDFYQSGYRNYDAQLGRFIAVDPLALHDNSVSPYIFSSNSPVMYNDPSGLLKMHFENSETATTIQSMFEFINAASVGWNGDGSVRSYNAGGGGGGISANDLWSQVLNAFDAMITNKSNYGTNFYRRSDGTFNTYRFTSQNDAFGYGNEQAYSDGYFGVGQNAVSGFRAANQRYNSLEGVDLSLLTPILYEGRIWVKSNIIIPNSWDDVLRQLARNGFVDLASHYNVADALNHTGLGIDYASEGLEFAKDFGEFVGKGGGTKIIAGATRGLAVLSFAVNVLDAANNKKWSIHNTVDLAVTGVAMIPGFGTAFAAGWFLGNMISEFATGKSLSEHIEEGINDF